MPRLIKMPEPRPRIMQLPLAVITSDNEVFVYSCNHYSNSVWGQDKVDLTYFTLGLVNDYSQP